MYRDQSVSFRRTSCTYFKCKGFTSTNIISLKETTQKSQHGLNTMSKLHIIGKAHYNWIGVSAAELNRIYLSITFLCSKPQMWHRSDLKCVPHVQVAYFYSLDQSNCSLLQLSLPSMPNLPYKSTSTFIITRGNFPLISATVRLPITRYRPLHTFQIKTN